MSITETIEQVPATQRARTTRTCDICKTAKTKPGSDEWNSDSQYAHDEVEISSTHREHYPEYGSAEGVTCDCCPECFKTKAQPALEALGLVFRKTEVNW